MVPYTFKHFHHYVDIFCLKVLIKEIMGVGFLSLNESNI